MSEPKASDAGRYWSTDRVAELIRLRDEGISAKAIALRLGTTTNAVIGKSYRLALAASSPLRKPDASPTASAKVPNAALRPRDESVSNEPVSLGLSLVALQPGQCKWPHGDGPFVFCGHPADAGEAYCPAHRARATRPDSLRRTPFIAFRRARIAA